MRAGAEVIYQAALVAPPWLGYADFLERVDEASNLGAWSYEPVDTKLSRTAKPDHVIQLATYSKLIGNDQGRTPTEMHVELGNGKKSRSGFPTSLTITRSRSGDWTHSPTGHRRFRRGTMWSLSDLSLV